MRLRALLLLAVVLAACSPRQEPAPGAGAEPGSDAASADATASASDDDDSDATDDAAFLDASEDDDEPTPDESAAITHESRLAFGGVDFNVKAYGTGNRKLLVVKASREGAAVGEPGRITLDGDVLHAYAADLDEDEAPEILVFARERGPGRRGSFAGLTLVGDTFQALSLPALDRAQAKGYRGGDAFSVDARHVIRRFPVFEGAGETPTARTRTIAYTLNGADLSVDSVRE